MTLNLFYFTVMVSRLRVILIFVFIYSYRSPGGCGQNGKLHWINWWQSMPSKPLWKLQAVLILSAYSPPCMQSWTIGDKVLLNILHPTPPFYHRPTYLVNMPPTVRFLHFAVVPIEASVGPANEFYLLLITVLIAKPETIESINGVFSPLNHAVYYPPSSPARHHFIIPAISSEASPRRARIGSRNGSLRWKKIHIHIPRQSLTLRG